MRKTIVLLTVISFLATGLIPAFAGVALADAPVINRDYAGLESPGLYYPDPYGLFWDLTRGDLTISYKLDMSGFTPPQGNQDWTEIGLYSSSGRTGWINSGAPGAYLGDTDLHDSNDKLSLNSVFRENEEWSYNATGPETLISDWGIPWKPWLNCGIWFDRGHVDTGQSQQGGLYDGGTYNTGGVYDVSITYHAIDNAAGTMFATVNGVPTGFYSASHQGDPDYSPVGKTFYGDMTREAVYAKVMGEGVKISDFSISGCPGEPQLYGIWPTTAEQGESLKDMFFNGAQFRDVPITAQLSNPNTGETAVAGRTVYVANFQIRADIDIPETATVGLWDADCWHNDDTEAVATLPQSFMVTNATPRINAIDNNHCRPGANITMAVTGKYFRNTPMTIKLLRGGEILEGKNIKWISSNQVNVDFTIPADATIACDWAISLMHNDDGKCSTLYNTFSVDAKIDINPFSRLNLIWLRAPGILPVVMYSEPGFDATSIFPLAVSFADTLPIYWYSRDVNRDRKNDLVLFFYNGAANLPVGTHSVSVLGASWDGRRVNGYNTVRVFKLFF